jgi:hypothetical protein
MDGDIPTIDNIELALHAAKSAFMNTDVYLLEVNANERSITHKYAEHLQHALGNWNIDCEYNRDGRTPKELHGMARQKVRKDDSDAGTVYPDIIVHKRGKAGPNLLVIEAKKAGNKTTEDKEKLDLYRSQLHY